MKKKIITALLAIAVVGSITACSGTPSTPSTEVSETFSETETDLASDFEEEYTPISNAYGVTYEVPASWEEATDNSDDMAYFYKNGIGNGDGMFFAYYHEGFLDFSDESNLSDYIDGFASGVDDGKVSSKTIRVNGIQALELTFTMKNYPSKSITFNLTDGIFMFAMGSSVENEYDTYWNRILKSIKITDADSTYSTYGDVYDQQFSDLDDDTEEDTEPVTAETKVKETESQVPSEYISALKSAETYSEHMHMSKEGIRKQLTSEYGEQFSEEAANYAIENLDADWNENALETAKHYSDSMHMSKEGIRDQLTSEYGEQFTSEEADYAVENLDADWNENALETAKHYRDSMNMSPSAIHDQLTSEYGEQFTSEEADYAIEHLDD